MKKITLVMAAIAIASVFVGCGPKTEDATTTAAGGNGTADSKTADTAK